MTSNRDEALVGLFETALPEIAAELGRENVRHLLGEAVLIEVPKGRQLIRQGMAVGYVYFLLEGQMRAYIEADGGVRELNKVRPGQWLGEVSVLSGGGQAAASVDADSDCRLIRIHHVGFEKLISENLHIAKVLLDRFIALMADRYRAAIHLSAPAAGEK